MGYVNYLVEKKRSDILAVLLTGLSRLEYRGYDSAGLAIDGDNEADVLIYKQVNIHYAFISLNSYAADCRYTISEQDGRFYIMKRLTGTATNLPAPDEIKEVKSKLGRGIKDVQYVDKEGNDQSFRVKVKADFKTKKEADDYLARRCH